MKKNVVSATVCAVATALAALSPAAATAQNYPNKPVRIVVPFPGGSATDGYWRVLAERAQAHLGQAIVVDPRPGAGAMIGAQYVLTQPADGYTFLMYTTSHAIRSAAPNPPFDIRKDFTGVTRGIGGTLFLAVNADKVPARTVKDFIDFAKANPGKVNFSSYGPNTLGNLGALLFARETGINVVHVPYNGSAANVVALARGDSHVTFDVISSLGPQLQANKVRILASGSAERFELNPEFPGFRESGLNFEIVALNGLVAAAGMPREAIDKMSAAVTAAAKEGAVIEHFRKIGQKVYGGSPEEFARLISAEYETFGKVIRENNIKFD